jgi:hypothetical protein
VYASIEFLRRGGCGMSFVKHFSILVLLAAMASFAFPQQSAKQDMKDAGHDTKQAAKHTGRAVKKGTKSTGHQVKKTSKSVAHKTAHKTKQGAQKVEDKTQPNP